MQLQHAAYLHHNLQGPSGCVVCGLRHNVLDMPAGLIMMMKFGQYIRSVNTQYFEEFL